MVQSRHKAPPRPRDGDEEEALRRARDRETIKSPLEWDDYYLTIAEAVAKRSKDPDTKVGAVLVAGEAYSIGYNGFPRGVVDYTHRWERPLKYTYVLHAEVNAILNADLKHVRQAGKHCFTTIYVTHNPCPECTKIIIQSGIKRIISAGNGSNSCTEYDKQIAQEMREEAGVIFEEILPIYRRQL